MAGPFQPTDLNFPKKALWQTESRISIQVVIGISLAALYNEQSVYVLCSFACKKMQNQIFELHK